MLKKKLTNLFVITLGCWMSLVEAQSGSIDNYYVILSGNANKDLSKKIGKILDKDVNTTSVNKFNDGEIRVEITENIRNRDVFIIQPLCKSLDNSVNDNIMELYLMIRAAKRASAKSINVIIPYYGYARQDRRSLRRAPISGAEVAILLEEAGSDRIVTVDLHCGQIEGFFRHIPVDNLAASRLFAKHLKEMKLTNLVLVSPDAGGVPRVTKFQKILQDQGIKSEVAMIVKQRGEAGKIASMKLIGEVRDKNAIILDDIMDTGGTLGKAADRIKEMGAKSVCAYVTHPVFSKNAMENIENSALTKIFITNSIPLQTQGVSKKVEIIGIEGMIARAINFIKDGRSITRSF